MPQASEIAWLIPVFPLIGAVLSGLGLISINKRINNSREIVSVSLISFVGISQFQWDLSLILWEV